MRSLVIWASVNRVHRWMSLADVDDGTTPGLTTDQRAELVQLRRDQRVLEMEIESLKRARAHFARENVLPRIWDQVNLTNCGRVGLLRKQNAWWLWLASRGWLRWVVGM